MKTEKTTHHAIARYRAYKDGVHISKLVKKLEIYFSELTFVILVLKVEYQVGLGFSNSNFFTNKIFYDW